MTLKDLGDDKLLQTKDKILEAILKSRQESDVALVDISLQVSTLVEASRHQKIACILNSLDFETRRSRESDIAEAEYRTFEWIFQDHYWSTNQYVGFRQWLLTGNGNFWISGKAGSGKSVLMSYISKTQDTQDLLQYWAGTARLIVAKYFFWNAGSPMQKSELGLLQTLLREICGQCPDLVPVVCPSRWSRCYDIGGTWTRHEILEAFKKLEGQQLLELKFCFFVDGVDEYEGDDYTHIVEVLENLSASPSVKICLSSRPWNIFTTAFSVATRQPLLLEELNEADIQRYTNSKFESDETFMVLRCREPNYDYLVKSIVENARGVFLWVKLVVGNLLRGMSNNDSLFELHQRLQNLPTTLSAYYQHMFDNIDEYYRKDTAELLLLCLEGLQPFSLLNLWFYEQEKISSNYALQAETSSLSHADVDCVFEKLHKRINARGQDLLVIEVNKTTNHKNLKYVVRFSHHTVKDFLSKKEMFEKLTAWASMGLDARVILCKATLAIAKSLLTSTDIHSTSESLQDMTEQSETVHLWWKFVSNFFTYASLAERNECVVDDALIDEFQRFSCLHLVPHERRMIADRMVFYMELNDPDRPELLLMMRDISSGRAPDPNLSKMFFGLAVEANLKHYAKSKLMTKLNLEERPFEERSILDRALRPSLWLVSTPKLDIEMIRLLLTNGASPNEETVAVKYSPRRENTVWICSTVWGLFLQHLRNTNASRNQFSNYDSFRDEYEVTRLLIEFGASADLWPWRNILDNDVSGGPRSTPLSVIREVFPFDDAIALEQHLEKHRPRALRQASIYLRRIMRRLHYHDVYIIRASLRAFIKQNRQDLIRWTISPSPLVAVPCWWFVVHHRLFNPWIFSAIEVAWLIILIPRPKSVNDVMHVLPVAILVLFQGLGLSWLRRFVEQK